jgi:hypothetical protein
MRSDNTLLQQARISAVTAWIDGVTSPFHQQSGREWNRLIFLKCGPLLQTLSKWPAGGM